MWNDFVESSKNATFLFHRDFMDYHNDRFEDFSLMIYKGDELYALLPANRKGTMLFSHQGLTYGGFLLSKSATLLSAFESFKTMLSFLSSQGIEGLDLRITPSFYNLMPSDEIEYFMFKSKAQLIKRDVMMLIDYDHKIRFKKNRREGINKAKRNGLEIRIESNFANFWHEVLIPNLSEKHDSKPVHTLEEIELLASRFPENIKQVNVYKDDEIVAGTTVFLTHRAVHPQYVSGNADKNAYGSLDLLYDFIIEHFAEGRRYFNFNTSSEQNGTVLNKGLLFWKETCGARAFTIDNYLIKTASYKNLNLELK